MTVDQHFDYGHVVAILRRSGVDAGGAPIVASRSAVRVYGGTRGGCYAVIPHGDVLKVEWEQPPKPVVIDGVEMAQANTFPAVLLDVVPTPERAAGLILDHQANLLP